jgi:PadR family transcriptional regulator, regulatory protein PadR
VSVIGFTVVAQFRVTHGMVQVLEALSTNATAEWWGLEIAAVCGLPATTVYGILARLEDARIVEAAFEQEDPRDLKRAARRLYRLTPLGEREAPAVIAEWRNRRGTRPRLRESFA